VFLGDEKFAPFTASVLVYSAENGLKNTWWFESQMARAEKAIFAVVARAKSRLSPSSWPHTHTAEAALPPTHQLQRQQRATTSRRYK